MAIHPWAVVAAEARIGRDVTIGPFCVIEPGATIGDGCVLESHVVVKQDTTLGENNRVYEGAILGGLPQHTKMQSAVGQVRIGAGNTIREHTTIHRSLMPDHATIVGDNNFLMANAHVAHDCHVGSHTIFANNATLGGHVLVEDRAYVSGSVAVHQFCRIGQLAMVGGLARVIKDVPPFVTIDGNSGYVVGLNTVGLRRNGLDAEAIAALKAAYRVIYRSGLKWQEILNRLRAEFTSGPAAAFAEFLSETRRGIVAERRLPPGATIKITEEAGVVPTASVTNLEHAEPQAKVG